MRLWMTLVCCIVSNVVLLAQLQYDFKHDRYGKVIFDQIVRVDSLSKEELFVKGKEWLYEAYNSGSAVLEFEDKDFGKIIGTAHTQPLLYKSLGIDFNGGYFEYRLSLLFKDGRSKILIDNIVFRTGEIAELNNGARLDEEYPKVFTRIGKKRIKKKWQLMRKQAIVNFELLLASYQMALQEVDDEW